MKRGREASLAGRGAIWARMEDALKARTVVEYNM